MEKEFDVTLKVTLRVTQTREFSAAQSARARIIDALACISVSPCHEAEVVEVQRDSNK